MSRPERQGIMLANIVTENKLEALYPYCIAQPKLNGERCRVEWFHNEPILFSSYGNEFAFKEQIKACLCAMPKENYDGELYVHGWSRDKIASVANRKTNKHADDDLLEFHVFDIQDMYNTQAVRTNILEGTRFNGNVKRVPHMIITPRVIMAATRAYIDAGYEGIILRDIHGYYEMRRTNVMLKYKPTKVDYYMILKLNEAESEDGEPLGMVGSFVVASKEREPFSVSAGKLKHDERRLYWAKRTEIPGRWLKVKHEEIKTSGGVPVSCVALQIVDMIGE